MQQLVIGAGPWSTREIFGDGSQADSSSGQKPDDILQDASDAELCASECSLAALALAMQISLVLCS